jgi:hypothetical protein
MSPSERREMIRKEKTDLSLSRQCKLPKISRSSIYYTPVGFDQVTIDLMHEFDRIFKKFPVFGNPQIAAYLPYSGFSAGRQAGPEHFTATFVGNQSARSQNTLTYGLYSAGISDEQKREVVEGVSLPTQQAL